MVVIIINIAITSIIIIIIMIFIIIIIIAIVIIIALWSCARGGCGRQGAGPSCVGTCVGGGSNIYVITNGVRVATVPFAILFWANFSILKPPHMKQPTTQVPSYGL